MHFQLHTVHQELRSLTLEEVKALLTFNSTRYIRNLSCGVGDKEWVGVSLSTPHGTLGTPSWHSPSVIYDALSTPHGTLGTDHIIVEVGKLRFKAFNSTRYIRNEDYGTIFSILETSPFNSTRYIRNKDGKAIDKICLKSFQLHTVHQERQEFAVPPLPEQLSTPHGTLGTGTTL